MHFGPGRGPTEGPTAPPLRSAAVAPEQHVEALAEAKAGVLAQLGHDGRLGQQLVAGCRLGHEQNALGGHGGQAAQQRLNLADITLRIHDEFELAGIRLDQRRQGLVTTSRPLMGGRQVRLARDRIAQLGTDAHEVAGEVADEDNPGRFDRGVFVEGLESLRQFDQTGSGCPILAHEGLAPCDDDEPARPMLYLPDEVGQCIVFSAREVPGVSRVTPSTSQRATGQTNEDAGRTGENAFALERVERFSDTHGYSAVLGTIR